MLADRTADIIDLVVNETMGFSGIGGNAAYINAKCAVTAFTGKFIFCGTLHKKVLTIKMALKQIQNNALAPLTFAG